MKSQQDRANLILYLKRSGTAALTNWFKATCSTVNMSDFGMIPTKLETPYLYLSPNPDLDPTYPPAISSGQNANCADITTKSINTGHWIFVQDAEGAVRLVLDWGKEKGLF